MTLIGAINVSLDLIRRTPINTPPRGGWPRLNEFSGRPKKFSRPVIPEVTPPEVGINKLLLLSISVIYDTTSSRHLFRRNRDLFPGQ